MKIQEEWGRAARAGNRVAIAVAAEHPLRAGSSLLRVLAEDRLPNHAVTLLDRGVDHSRAALTTHDFDLLHLADSGPTAQALLPLARKRKIPVTATYSTALADLPPALFTEAGAVLSPSAAADDQLLATGIEGSRICRWLPGVDPAQFHPARYTPEVFGLGVSDPSIRLLYVSPDGDPGELETLADAFLRARELSSGLQLLIASELPLPPRIKLRLGAAASVLDSRSDSALAPAYASADLLVVPGQSDVFGETVVAAQASGLAVLAVAGGAADELIESGRSGLLVPRGAAPLSEAIGWLARRATLRERLATGGLLAVRASTWERSLARLSAAWDLAASPAEVVCAA
jgi:glycosyltransferase involved in cell wall biosynthesis